MDRKINIIIVSILLLLMPAVFVLAQTKKYTFPKVGDKIMNHTFSNLINEPREQVSINDYKGKWLILDFWGSYCSGCIASFPKLNELHYKFKSKVKIIAVGATSGTNERLDGDRKTKLLFDLNRNKYNLDFTAAFDSTAAYKYGANQVPHILIINPFGVVMSVTTKIDETIIKHYLNGGNPLHNSLIDSYRLYDVIRAYDFKVPLLTSGDLTQTGIDTTFFYRSLFVKWNKSMIQYQLLGFEGGINKSPDLLGRRAELFGFSLEEMIRLAYIKSTAFLTNEEIADSIYFKVVFETKNSDYVKPKNYEKLENCYAYSITGPLKSKVDANSILLGDLKNAFKISITTETRELPVWKIIVVNPDLIKRNRTKGQAKSISSINEFMGYNLTNWSIDDIRRNILHNSLYNRYGGEVFEIPHIVDETGIDYNLDLTIEGYYKDYDEIRKSLNNSGLDLVPGIKNYKCILVRDATPLNK